MMACLPTFQKLAALAGWTAGGKAPDPVPHPDAPGAFHFIIRLSELGRGRPSPGQFADPISAPATARTG
jgi:hypothetical protein